MLRISTLLITTLWVVACFASSAPSPPPQNETIDFNALLDGSLGLIPALWLVSQGTLLQLRTAHIPRTPGLSTIIPNLKSFDTDRDKENGRALAELISDLMVPAMLNVDDNKTAEHCQFILVKDKDLPPVVLLHEAGNDTNSTASPSAQDVFPSDTQIAVMRALCNKLAPELTRAWDPSPKRMSRASHRGFEVLVTSHLRDMGVQSARAAQFATQLLETLKSAEYAGMSGAFEVLNRNLTTETAQLAKAVGQGKEMSTLALSNLARLSAQTFWVVAGPGIAVAPSSPALGPLGFLQTFMTHYSQAVDFAMSVPGASSVASRLSPDINHLRDAAMKAGNSFRDGASDLAPRGKEDFVSFGGALLDEEWFECTTERGRDGLPGLWVWVSNMSRFACDRKKRFGCQFRDDPPDARPWAKEYFDCHEDGNIDDLTAFVRSTKWDICRYYPGWFQLKIAPVSKKKVP